MDMKEKTLKKNTVYDGHIIKVRLDEALSAEGDKIPREVVEHPGGVGIALETEAEPHSITAVRSCEEFRVFNAYVFGLFRKRRKFLGH